MSIADRDKRLVQVDTKLNILITQMNRVIYEPGPARCVVRGVRLDALEKETRTVKKLIFGLWMAAISFILAEAVPRWSPLISKLF